MREFIENHCVPLKNKMQRLSGAFKRSPVTSPTGISPKIIWSFSRELLPLSEVNSPYHMGLFAEILSLFAEILLGSLFCFSTRKYFCIVNAKVISSSGAY